MALSIRCPRALALAGALLFVWTAALPEPALAAPDAVAATKGKHAVSYRRLSVGGVKIFYREAGLMAAPVIVLLHGFPSSSQMSRT